MADGGVNFDGEAEKVGVVGEEAEVDFDGVLEGEAVGEEVDRGHGGLKTLEVAVEVGSETAVEVHVVEIGLKQDKA